MKKNKVYLLFGITLALFLQSCRTIKKTEQPTVHMIEIKDVYRYVTTNQRDFKTMNISKMNLSFKMGGQSYNVRGFIRMVKDSAIMISIQPIPGIEVVRAQILPGEITVVDRINSQYYVSTAEQLKAVTGIDFEFNTLQALLSNQLFLPGIEREKITEKMFDVGIFPPDAYEMKAAKNSLPFHHSFIINKELQLEKVMMTGKKSPQSLTYDYADFSKVNAYDFPHKMTITVFDGQKSERVGLAIGSVDFDVPVNMSFSIPAKYSKADIEQISF